MGVNRWKLLIVDDEIRIGKMIRQLIRWDELGLTCAGIFDNGEAAYEYIQNNPVDIVITDIRMPKITGLDLISMVNEHYSVKFVVVSGYKEFEYAQKAMQHSVRDYLLKPINADELNSVLEKISVELSMEKNDQQQMAKMEKVISASESILKSKLLNILRKLQVQVGHPVVDSAPS